MARLVSVLTCCVGLCATSACGPVRIAILGEDTAVDTGTPSTDTDTDTDYVPPDTSPPPVETADTAPDTDSPPVDTGVTDTIDPIEPVDPTDRLFADDEILTYEILLSDESFEALLEDPYTYVEGALLFEGDSYVVGVRTKGQNSWRPINEKPSLKVKMDWVVKDQEFYELEELTFNAMNDDPTMMHERVAYRMYREADIPAARATHAWMVVNGIDYGLYTHLETVDKTMMRRWFDNADGILWEQWDVDFYDEYIPCPNPGEQACFELEYGTDDRSILQAIADAFESGSLADQIEAASQTLDYAQFIRYWAVGSVTAQTDAYPYSDPGDDCHVYFDVESSRLIYVPHGVDETFVDDWSHPGTNADGILSTKCYDDPTCRSTWEAEVFEILDIADAIGLFDYAAEVKQQIEPHVAADNRKHYSTSSVYDEQEDMLQFISQRRSKIENWLD